MDKQKYIEPNYKKKKYYKTAKYPIRQPLFFTWLIQVLSKMMLCTKKHSIEKINMDNIKPPYMLLSNHMHFVDFEMGSLLTYPHRVNNVISLDGYYRRAWLMEWIGGIATRKFTMDLHLIKSINKVLKRGDILSMYPEARYTPIGTTSYLPDSLGKIIKMNKVPVVTIMHHGNYLHSPFWDYRHKRKAPLHSVMQPILSVEQIQSMSVDEINKVVRKAFEYNDYEYQKERGFLIKEDFRAQGLHKVLYQCPKCKAEHKMASQGTEIYCTECGKRWTLNEDSTLSANDGKTEFVSPPEWFEWQREQVRKQVEGGTYSYQDEVDVYSLPGCYRYVHLGKAKFSHDIENGFVIEGHYRNQDYRVQRYPQDTNSLHIEYDYCYKIHKDCVDISTEKDSFYCYPSKENVRTKLALATEEIFKLKQKQIAKLKKQPTV